MVQKNYPGEVAGISPYYSPCIDRGGEIREEKILNVL
jgi:hypothetical protein